MFNKQNPMANLLFSQLKRSIMQRKAADGELKEEDGVGLDDNDNEINNEYIWGVELIFVLKTGAPGGPIPIF